MKREVKAGLAWLEAHPDADPEFDFWGIARPVPRLEMVVGSPRVFVRIGPALRFEGVARCHCGTEWVTTLKQQTASHKKALAAAREAPLAEGWGITANHQGTVVVVACPWCRAGHGVDGRDIDMEATP